MLDNGWDSLGIRNAELTDRIHAIHDDKAVSMHERLSEALKASDTAKDLEGLWRPLPFVHPPSMVVDLP